MKTARDRNDPQESPGPDDLGASDSPVGAASVLADDARDVADAFARCWPTSPFRSLDWRWGLAGAIRDGHPSPRRSGDDRWLGAALRLRERVQPRAGDPRRHRTRRDHHVDVAYQFRFGADARRRLQLEARLLSGQEIDVIALRLGIEAGAVEAYARCFYDVLDHLEKIDYIMRSAIGRAAYTGFLATDDDIIVKLISYNLGPLAVDALAGWLGWPVASGAPPISAEWSRAIGRRLEFLIGVMTVPVNDQTRMGLIRLAGLVGDIDRREREYAGTHLTGAIRSADDLMTAEASSPGSRQLTPPDLVEQAEVDPDEGRPTDLAVDGPGPDLEVACSA
jgi:hypothetical protein